MEALNKQDDTFVVSEGEEEESQATESTRRSTQKKQPYCKAGAKISWQVVHAREEKSDLQERTRYAVRILSQSNGPNKII
jgi:hypothetical protein